MHSGNPMGAWESGPVLDKLVAVHMALLHTGKVLMFSGDHETHGGLAVINKGRTSLWNPKTNEVKDIPLERNLFCAGHCFLPDGRLLVAGGQHLSHFPRIIFGALGFAGAEKDIHTFDPNTEAWTRHKNMPNHRWYPTCATLPNGKAIIVAGYTYLFWRPNQRREYFDPTTNTLSKKTHFHAEIGVYPFLQVLPGGILFVFTANKCRLFDLNTESFVGGDFFSNHQGTRNYDGQGSCVPLSIEGADPLTVQILMIGGSTSLSPDDDTDATRTAEIFVFDVRNPVQSRWEQLPDMPHPRLMSDGILLPDGSVFVTNGASRGHAESSADARKESYIFDLGARTWTTVAESPRERGYHSTAVLLLDGRVLVGGSTGHDFSHRDDEFHLDIYSPPYLSRGPRPQITSIPGTIEYGATFTIGTPDSRSIDEVCMIRPCSTSHTNNMDQRRVRLTIVDRGPNGIRCVAPSAEGIAPPGHYMVFILDGDIVPSIAAVTHLS